uniref:Uncharacterized protein n=1 Tax=Arundo donax TaxID=35708 RepID=A0A0A9AH75_ARUDO
MQRRALGRRICVRWLRSPRRSDGAWGEALDGDAAASFPDPGVDELPGAPAAATNSRDAGGAVLHGGATTAPSTEVSGDGASRGSGVGVAAPGASGRGAR